MKPARLTRRPGLSRPTRASAAGFTLVELMVALVAGLVVSMAMVGLSKEATNTFHEEARNAAAESALRNGMERLRADLNRASFMSTGNILADDAIHYQTYGGSILGCTGSASTVVNYAAAPGLKHLAGIHLYQGTGPGTGASGNSGTTAATVMEGANGLYPDMIDIGGNFTNGEEYFVRVVPPSDPNLTGNTACGTQVLWIQNTTGSAWRLSQAGSAAFTNAFHPGTSTSTQYMVRIGDTSSPMHYQYALICASNPVYFAPGPPMVAAINIDPSTPLAVSDTGKVASCATPTTWNAGTGQVRASAVQIVRWDVAAAGSLPAAYGLVNDPNELVLTRQFVDGKNVTDPSTLEVVAEYVVDLKFAFSIDPTSPATWSPIPGAYPTTNANGTVPPNPLIHFPFDDAANQTWAADVKAGTGGANGDPTPGPQRIRSTRIRLVTRTALPDRSQATANPAALVPSATGSENFIYRYCTGPNAGWNTTTNSYNPSSSPGVCAAHTPTWARARTDVTEVALPNQRQLFY